MSGSAGSARDGIVPEPADLAFVRVWPYGGGGNLALARSAARFGSGTRTILFTDRPTSIAMPPGDGTRFEIRPLKAQRLRLGATLFARVARPDGIVESARVLDIAEATNGFAAGVARTAVRHGVPFVVTCLETLAPPPLARWPPWREHAKFLARHAARFRVLTQRGRQSALSLGVEDERIVRLPIGIDTRAFHPAPSPVEHRPITYLFARRLEPKNGVVEMLSAFRSVRARIPSARLVLAGDGPLRPIAQEAARVGLVEYLGNVRYDALPEVYRRCDVFCNPGRDVRRLGRVVQEDGQYTFPLLEAQASGLAVVTTDSGSDRELVPVGNRFVPQGNVDAFASAMLEFAVPEAAREIGTANREQVVRNYSAETLQPAMDDLVRSLTPA